MHRQLGISRELVENYRLDFHSEGRNLQDIGENEAGRMQRLTADTAAAWFEMQRVAASQGIILAPVSGFRSYEVQADIIQRKLQSGLRIEDIVRVVAIPGFSQHHSGQALDINTENCPALEEEFENTPAFRWLLDHAHSYHFSLSYPRDNSLGIIYEPWHWYFEK